VSVATFSANILIIGWLWSIASNDSAEPSGSCAGAGARDDVATGGGRGGIAVDGAAFVAEDAEVALSIATGTGCGNP